MTILVAIGATIFAALLLAGIGVYWATHESDAVSVERQARSARHAMEMSVDELALQQETVAIWDDSITKMVADPLDISWLHYNIGSWLNGIFGHDEVFILDGFNQPAYASVAGKQAPLARYSSLSADLKYLLNSVRGLDGGRNGRHDRNPGLSVHPENTVRTTPRATHDSHIMLIGGRPAAASAMLIQPSTPGYAKPRGDWPVLVSIRYLDAGFLAELSSRQLIASPRFSRKHDRRPGEYEIHLVSDWGQAIGHLVWKPELPGTRILSKLVPINLLVLIVLASVMAFLGSRLRKAAGELGAAEAHAHHLAFHDSLTGLPNRALFQRKLDQLTSGQGAPPGFALLLLDVDEFKLTNDTMGHDAGDALIRAFADRLRFAVRSGDLVARLGGDEFGLLLMGMEEPGEVKAFAADVLEWLGEPIEHHGKPIHSRASIGASCSNGAGTENMLKHADLALYQAKASGRGAFRLYNASMWSNMQLRGEMLSIAAAALEGDFVKPFYQPKIDLKTGAIVGFEALLRCCLPGREPEAAGCIAAAFDDSTLAVKLSDRMVDAVISDILEWRAGGLEFGHVAINAALAELRRGDFAAGCLANYETPGSPPTASRWRLPRASCSARRSSISSARSRS